MSISVPTLLFSTSWHFFSPFPLCVMSEKPSSEIFTSLALAPIPYSQHKEPQLRTRLEMEVEMLLEAFRIFLRSESWQILVLCNLWVKSSQFKVLKTRVETRRVSSCSKMVIWVFILQRFVRSTALQGLKSNYSCVKKWHRKMLITVQKSVNCTHYNGPNCPKISSQTIKRNEFLNHHEVLWLFRHKSQWRKLNSASWNLSSI